MKYILKNTKFLEEHQSELNNYFKWLVDSFFSLKMEAFEIHWNDHWLYKKYDILHNEMLKLSNIEYQIRLSKLAQEYYLLEQNIKELREQPNSEFIDTEISIIMEEQKKILNKMKWDQI